MDRRVKERLVGASILVALIVLIVPELLSGPVPSAATARPAASAKPAAHAPEPVRNVTVDLATSKAPEPASDAVDALGSPPPETPRVAAAGAAAGAAGPGAAGPGATAAEPASAAPVRPPTAERGADRATSGAAREPALPAAPPRAAAAVKSGGSWALQLGSFASHANADNLVRRLKAQGFSVYTAAGGPASKARYRVRVGPLADRGTAAQTAAKLKALGHASRLVPPAP